MLLGHGGFSSGWVMLGGHSLGTDGPGASREQPGNLPRTRWWQDAACLGCQSRIPRTAGKWERPPGVSGFFFCLAMAVMYMRVRARLPTEGFVSTFGCCGDARGSSSGLARGGHERGHPPKRVRLGRDTHIPAA